MRQAVILHYETSRLRKEAAPMPRLGRAGRLAREAEPTRLSDLIPWALLAVIALAGLSAIDGMNGGDPACMSEVEGSSWTSDEIGWPPGVRCVVVLPDGTTVVDNPGWGPVVVAAAAFTLIGVGLVRRSPPWRRAAQVTLIPTTVAVLAWAYLFTQMVAFAVVAVILALAAFPAAVTWALLYAFTTWPSGRAFVGAWLGWALTPLIAAGVMSVA